CQRGTRSIPYTDNAELSTSTAFLEVPSWDFRPIVNALGGTFNNDLSLYTVDCSKLDSIPSITINMGSGEGLTYAVRAQDFVAKIDGKNGGECALLIMQGNDGWVVGTQFLPKRCVHLDYAKSRVAFADPKN
ncbi:aspartic proteinase AspMD02, partial [Aphelenchoides avenae]